MRCSHAAVESCLPSLGRSATVELSAKQYDALIQCGLEHRCVRLALYPASRALPLALRRLMIFLPCLVDIRLRKPWFLARFNRLG
jgi:hypothetical protein